MDLFVGAFDWMTDPAQWSGDNGIPARLLEHFEILGLAMLLAALVALPVGMYIGHTRRMEFLAVSVANVGRAIPSFGLLAILFPLTLQYNVPGSIGFAATLIAMVLLALPPLLTNAYVGVQTVDAETVEAARGMGLSGGQVLLHLELPLAAPLIVAGIRTAAVQVVATATLGALVGWGGLGRFITFGFAIGVRREGGPIIVAGAILVAALAVLTELSLAGLERLVRPRTSSRGRRRSRVARQPAPAA